MGDYLPAPNSVENAERIILFLRVIRLVFAAQFGENYKCNTLSARFVSCKCVCGLSAARLGGDKQNAFREMPMFSPNCLVW